MNLSLYSGATGMQAQQLNLNVISNNIANVNTTGYKKNKIEFQDLLYQNPGNLEVKLVRAMLSQLESKWEMERRLFQQQKFLPRDN